MSEPDRPDDLAARLAALSPQARAQLDRRLAERRALRRTIPRRDPDEAVPMSFAQWRLWFLEQLRPGTNAWNTPVAVRLHGPLDVEALHRSLEMLIDRHATLRTVFVAPGGKPGPVALPDPVVELPVTDAPARDAAAHELLIRRFVDQEVGRPFDLAHDLMLRMSILRLADQDHVVVLVAHHIACDGWSKGLLLDELSTAYDALSRGSQPSLPELPIEYADYAIWQRRWLTGENLARLTEYWQSRLEGHPPALDMPTDHKRPPTQAFRGAVRWLALPAALADAARGLGRQERATPFITMLAAFNALLYAHSGQEDLLVGSPSAMRGEPELERIVGLFANTLVYRTDVTGRPSFRELVRRVRSTALGVYENQAMPFEKIVEVVRPPRDASRNPLVQVNLRLEGREPELRLREIRSDPVVLDPGIARFDLAIELGATDDEGYAGYLEYDTALFAESTASAMADDLVALVEAAVDSPDRPLPDLEPVREIRARRRA